MSNGLSMRTKLLILLGCMFLVTISLGFIWFQKSTDAIEKNAIEYSSQLVQTTNAHLDSYFYDIERLTLPMLSSKQTLDFITESGDDAFSRYSTSFAVEKDLIPPIMLNRSDILGISLVSEGNIASSSISFIDAEKRYPEYIKLIPDVGAYKIIGLNKIGFDQVNALTMAMRFVDTRTTRTTGMMIIDLYLKRIEAICKDIRLGDSGFVWLVDERGTIITHPNQTLISQQVAESYLQHFNLNNHGYYVTSSKQEKKLIIYDRSLKTGLIMVAEVKLGQLNESLIRLSHMSMIYMVIFFLIMFFIVGGVSYRFTNSIIVLKRLMLRAELGDLTALAPKDRKDEIGSLYRSYNNMVTEITELIDVVQRSNDRERFLEIKQKEAVLRAMQSQINPHFLYNTLEVINAYAIIDNNLKVSNMIISLGDMFRYSIGSPTALVTLADEINHIRSYLKIQQERFEHLHYHIQVVEEDLHRYTALRLMLQPIVENSFKHGYDKHKLRPGTIKITGIVEANGYSLHIHDTGRGMEPELLKEINLAFQGNESSSSEGANKSNNIGLMNVHSRIRITFGEPYGLLIVKSNNKGTTIRISLPINNQDYKLKDGFM
ncbi:MAG: histidine kinase [Gorillibacterium sp.]|nr:histidine kinase [Gorillibacterium sp.]